MTTARKDPATVKDAIKLARDRETKLVDLKFTDFFGRWQHITLPAHRLDEDLFEQGLGFDGSSLRGWQPINASDMLLKPDFTTMRFDPFMVETTVSFICNVFDPISGQPYSRDPRHIAQKAEKYLQSTGFGDQVFVGPEAEFFVFDEVRYDLKPHASFFSIDSMEGAWNTGRDERPNLGYKPGYKGGYFPVPPLDSLSNLRNEMTLELERAGITVEIHHHEVATAGQSEIGIERDSLVRIADKLQWFRYIVRNVARRHQKTVTFMPKPIHGDNGSGMHVHMSVWKDGEPTFAGDKYAGMSQTALHFIGGIIEHGQALLALTNPTTNSYKRLVPGYEAPTKLAYSSRNRSAAIRIPLANSPKARRFEFRTPDSTSNCYLAFAAILMAGLDGIDRQLDPGKPMDKDIYNLPPEELANIPAAPASLDEALAALENDYEFLTRGNVFTQDVLETWIRYKFEHEIVPTRQRPTPLEYALYFDV
jgi:glutamine synthetase